MYLDLTEEQKLIQDTAGNLPRPNWSRGSGLDREGTGRRFLANLKKLAELGFMGLNVKDTVRRIGGRGRGLQRGMIEIARACASTAVTVSVNNMVCEVIQAVGSEAQKRATSRRSAPESTPPEALP